MILPLISVLVAAAAVPQPQLTFYRWTQKFPKVCPDLAKMPRVLAVGDRNSLDSTSGRAERRMCLRENFGEGRAPLV